MRNLLLIVLLISCSSLTTATINKPPEYSLLWSSFGSINMMNEFGVVTTDEGLVVLAYDSLFKTYSPVNHLFLESQPVNQKISGSVLAVMSKANIIYFIDLSDLPSLELLGEADIGFPFNDYACYGQDIYIANGFNGLWRYTMVNYGSLRLADSSNIGINYTQVDISGTDLYALDNYNGVLKYNLTGISFGDFEKYLYVPLKTNSFEIVDTTIALALNQPKMMLGYINNSEAEITDTFDLFFNGDRIYGIDSLLVAVNSEFNIAEMINSQTGEQYQFVLDQAPDSSMGGDAFIWQNENHLIFPSADGGLSLYNLDQIKTNPEPVPYFNRPGPIMDLAMWRDRLYVSGFGNPVDIFYLTPDGEPAEQETLYPGFPNTSHIHQIDNYLAIMYPRLYHVILMHLSPPPIHLDKAIFVGKNIEGIFYNDQPLDSLKSLFTYTITEVNGYSLEDTDSGSVITPVFDFSVIDHIYDIEFIDSLLFISTGKNKVEIYRIFSDFGISYQSNFGLPSVGTDLNHYNSKLLIMAGNNVMVVEPNLIGQVSPASVQLPFFIEDSYVDQDLLAVVGEQGFAIIDLAVDPPEILETGTRGGHIISIKNGIVAISNGNVVHIFDTRDVLTSIDDPGHSLPTEFTLSQNYPNPFNPSTTIRFNLPKRTKVTLEVFNVLGQKVIELVNAELPAGEHRVIWMGTNSSGDKVATGVYLYRLRSDNYSASHKMMLLK